MRRLQSESGATLIMVVGVIAALAILSSAMVALAVNVQHNTMTDRQQTTAFNVAEAGIDAGQSALWASWPGPTATAPAVPTSLAGGTVAVTVYDDDGATPPGIRRAYNNDANGNGRVWIESRGVYGQRAAKIMVCVEQDPFNLNIRGNVAIYGQSSMTLNGTGSEPVVGYEAGATGASLYARGTYTSNGNTVLAPGVTLNPDGTITIPDILPSETLLTLIRTAAAAQKVYVDQAAVPAAAWSSDPRIVVIEKGDVNLKDVPDTDTDATGPTVWSESRPGVLIALDPAGTVYLSGQKKAFYGILYAAGKVDLGGNPTWHGMILAEGGVTLSGTRAVIYNPNVIANLNRPIILAVKQVTNTWRELSAN